MSPPTIKPGKSDCPCSACRRAREAEPEVTYSIDLAPEAVAIVRRDEAPLHPSSAPYFYYGSDDHG